MHSACSPPAGQAQCTSSELALAGDSFVFFWRRSDGLGIATPYPGSGGAFGDGRENFSVQFTRAVAAMSAKNVILAAVGPGLRTLGISIPIARAPISSGYDQTSFHPSPSWRRGSPSDPVPAGKSISRKLVFMMSRKFRTRESSPNEYPQRSSPWVL